MAPKSFASVPNIPADSALNIEAVEEKYVESTIERRGKLLFFAGVFFGLVVFSLSVLLFRLWLIYIY